MGLTIRSSRDRFAVSRVIHSPAAVRLNSGVRPHVAAVKVQGWRVGFNKVECTKIIRAATGLGLAEAKAITDAIADGDTQLIHVVDAATAQKLADDLLEIGANASADAA